MQLTFIDDEVDAICVRGYWLPPHATVRALASDRAWVGDISQVRWRSGQHSWARASHNDHGFRIGAGVYGSLTILTAE